MAAAAVDLTTVAQLKALVKIDTADDVPTAVWAANTAFTAGQQIQDANRVLQTVKTAGTSGGTVPTWSTVLGGSTTDGTVVWTNGGPGLAQYLVTAMSRYVAQFCSRNNMNNVASVTDVLDGSGGDKLFMSEWPIITVVSVAVWGVLVP